MKASLVGLKQAESTGSKVIYRSARPVLFRETGPRLQHLDHPALLVLLSTSAYVSVSLESASAKSKLKGYEMETFLAWIGSACFAPSLRPRHVQQSTSKSQREGLDWGRKAGQRVR